MDGLLRDRVAQTLPDKAETEAGVGQLDSPGGVAPSWMKLGDSKAHLDFTFPCFIYWSNILFHILAVLERGQTEEREEMPAGSQGGWLWEKQRCRAGSLGSYIRLIWVSVFPDMTWD